MCSMRFAGSHTFSYELLYVTIKNRLYHQCPPLPPALASGVLPFGIVVTRSKYEIELSRISTLSPILASLGIVLYKSFTEFNGFIDL